MLSLHPLWRKASRGLAGLMGIHNFENQTAYFTD